MSRLEEIARDRGAYFTAAQLVDTVFPVPRWAVHGVIPEGLTLLAGAPKLGKSWLVLGTALAVAAGDRALGCIDVEAGPVLYAALEDTPRRLQARLAKLLGDRPAPADLAIVTLLPEMPLAVDLIAEWLDEHRDARMVVVDVLGKVRPPTRSSADRYENDYRVIGALKRLADNYGVAVVVVTHTRKMGADDPFDTVSGSTGLTGAADTTLVLRRARGETAAALHITGRDVSESEYAVTFDPLTGAWSLDGRELADAAARAAALRVTAGLGDRSADVVRYVSAHREGVRAAEVGTACGMSEKDAGTYLRRAFESGRIDRPARGLYAPSVGTVRSVGATDTQSDASYGSYAELGEDDAPLDDWLTAAWETVR